jgi:D-alanyl-D-alanine carboxypeptidase
LDEYLSRIRAVLDDLGISSESVSLRALPLQLEATELEPVGAGDEKQLHCLIPPAARAWRELHAAAASESISLSVVSAYRTLEKQADIVRAKLIRGVPIDLIFAASAPPGYSEHHTGRAIDVTTDGARALEEEFEDTPAFGWLTENAAQFDFVLSYPRGNRHGFIYEPWHWFYRRALSQPD